MPGNQSCLLLVTSAISTTSHRKPTAAEANALHSFVLAVLHATLTWLGCRLSAFDPMSTVELRRTQLALYAP